VLRVDERPVEVKEHGLDPEAEAGALSHEVGAG
jgi:hypothetical protein